MTNTFIPMIGTMSAGCCTVAQFMNSALFTGGSGWPTANKALYVPITVPETFIFNKFVFIVQLSSNNVDCGIYTAQGKKIVSTGSTAVPAAGCKTISCAVTRLEPGFYWLAMACDSTSPQFQRSTGGASNYAFYGVKEEAAAFALPATISLATDSTLNFLPLVAMGNVRYTW